MPETSQTLSFDELIELERLCKSSVKTLEKPTVAELEAILQAPETAPINIQPDGSITVGPPTVRIPVTSLVALLAELRGYRDLQEGDR